ncbi:MAG: anthranilate phosphoribosyltransferase [Candidatus Omnitrophica bacterium]|nr:anthranilate phosphoribosyltransferase [Candidatus Omnitrophota bacterium]MBI3020690.1 anthranilate phosphoribosyltransferase [Candidatus Omnitrophota bacterium]
MSFEQPLSAAAMQRTLEAIVSGVTPEEDVRTFLTTLARRGETAEEIAAAVQVLRAHAVPLPLSRAYELCDTCGTGGDRQGTINVSTLAALVAAAAGVRVAKHGNRAASSRCGSADLLEALGLNLQASPEQVARSIEELGFGFCFAQRFHPAMKAVAPIRKALGIRTLFNLVGPLANPARLTFQLVGVSDARLLRPMAEALMRLGIRHGVVVHGRDGMDEVTTTNVTDLLDVRDGEITDQRLDPEGLGLSRATLNDLRGADARHNARIAREVLEGTRQPTREIVLVNAGCAIYAADRAPTIADGMRQAAEALDSGRAATLLERVKQFSHA